MKEVKESLCTMYDKDVELVAMFSELVKGGGNNLIIL